MIWVIWLADLASLTRCQFNVVSCWVVFVLLHLLLEIIEASLLVDKESGKQVSETTVHARVVLAVVYRCESRPAFRVFVDCQTLVRVYLICNIVLGPLTFTLASDFLLVQEGLGHRVWQQSGWKNLVAMCSGVIPSPESLSSMPSIDGAIDGATEGWRAVDIRATEGWLDEGRSPRGTPRPCSASFWSLAKKSMVRGLQRQVRCSVETCSSSSPAAYAFYARNAEVMDSVEPLSRSWPFWQSTAPGRYHRSLC